MRRSTPVVLSCALVALVVSTSAMGQVAQGFTVTAIGPLLPGGSTTSTVVAENPVTGDIWMSNGQTLFRLDGMGGVAETIDLLLSQGGPVANNSVTTDLAFDSSGRFYINDFDNDLIFGSDDGADWDLFASVSKPRSMEFDSGGDLWTLGGNNDSTLVGQVNRIDALGNVAFVAASQGKKFTFDGDGNLIIPHFAATGIDLLTPEGDLSTLLTLDIGSAGLFESIAVTPDGHYVVGVNLGANSAGNQGKVIRVHGVTGAIEDIAFLSPLLPVDITFLDELGNELTVSAFGSLAPTAVSGDFDGPIGPLSAIPAPSALLGGAVLMGWITRRRRG